MDSFERMDGYSPEQIAAKLGIEVGPPVPPVGKYSAVTVAGDIAYTSGVVALKAPEWALEYAGRFGEDLDAAGARMSARGAMLCTLANLRGALGSLDRIDRFLRITGYVQSISVVTGLPGVLDGASELAEQLFGADSLPARSAIGVYALPGGASVELECTVLVRRADGGQHWRGFPLESDI
jgi:enamine deaminase RidA (YjgF/YER057c/UK114 family)